ncbi:UNKNOWN [Stylonychia lemnae]|uniref:Uncharacterized protein n=1 Tax=Stylonychia lemnae TaxID=5949 RepID=A0A078ANN3_STYLE|nr:UNKNOWN [Stylonychia lemnae]|eukprot:CDW83779.1 UNKNOWN [Stylonychia lemnae]
MLVKEEDFEFRIQTSKVGYENFPFVIDDAIHQHICTVHELINVGVVSVVVPPLLSLENHNVIEGLIFALLLIGGEALEIDIIIIVIVCIPVSFELVGEVHESVIALEEVGRTRGVVREAIRAVSENI